MGEFDASRMRQFTQAARDKGWRRVVQERMLDEDPNARTVLLSPSWTSFIDLLEPDTKYSILDLGAGMGRISQQLAKSFKKVYALDLTFERLAFLEVVTEQENVNGICTLCHRDVYNLSF